MSEGEVCYHQTLFSLKSKGNVSTTSETKVGFSPQCSGRLAFEVRLPRLMNEGLFGLEICIGR